MNRSQASVSSWARAIWISGIAWPKEMVAVFTMPSHFSQIGSVAAVEEGPPDRVELVTVAAIEAGGVGRVAVQLDDLGVRHARALVQPVDVLGDDGAHAPLLDQLGERAMAGVGLGLEHGLVGRELAAPGLPAHLLRRHEVVEVDRLVLGPDAAGRAEIRNAGFGRDAGAGEGDDPLGRTRSSRAAVRCRPSYSRSCRLLWAKARQSGLSSRPCHLAEPAAMPRHIVCLTFDHDHLSGFIARGMTSPTAISRGEYDVVVIPRLVTLLARYGVKATFFTPGHTIDSTPAGRDALCRGRPRTRPSRLDPPPARHPVARRGGRGDRPRQRVDQAHQWSDGPRLSLARLGSLAPLDRAAAEARHPLRQFDDGPRLRLLLRPAGRRGGTHEAVRARPRDRRCSRCRSAGRSTTSRTSNTCACRMARFSRA